MQAFFSACGKNFNRLSTYSNFNSCFFVSARLRARRNHFFARAHARKPAGSNVCARLRARLFPYIYSSAYHAAERAVPLLRPLYFDMPQDERAYNCPTTYMLGDSLLVSPITSRGEGEKFTAEKELFIPRGVWYVVFDGKRYTEGAVKVYCDIYSFPDRRRSRKSKGGAV